MKNKKTIIKMISIIIIIIIITAIIFISNFKKQNTPKIYHENINLQTTSSLHPYNFYKIYIYINDDDESWDSNTFYYQYLRKSDDSFFGYTINLEDKKIDPSIFDNYYLLAFVKKCNYNFTLDSYYLSNNCLELTLNESAIYEDFYDEPSIAFGGIFVIPKNEEIEDFDIYLNKKTNTDDYIIQKSSSNSSYDYVRNYSEKLIDESLVKECGLTYIEDFYVKIITNNDELITLSQKLNFIDDIDILDSTYKNFFSYRNILLCARNSNGTFYCTPDVKKDFYYQDLWPTQNLTITESYYNTSKENYITYYSLIFLPKVISLENINIEKKEINYKNFEDNDVNLDFKSAEKIAQNHLNTTSSLSSMSYLEIVNINQVKTSFSKESIENPCYRRMWSFFDKYYNRIYVDAATGDVIKYYM